MLLVPLPTTLLLQLDNNPAILPLPKPTVAKESSKLLWVCNQDFQLYLFLIYYLWECHKAGI
jgi:hypothetical protein